MIYRLAKGVQVRKEDWGLLFYSQAKSKIYFVKSGNRLLPVYSDGRFQPDSLFFEETEDTVTSAQVIEHSVPKLISHLMERGIIVNES
jgi:putative mycofactocin binding protein MftB